jgi:hypothetical protein
MPFVVAIDSVAAECRKNKKIDIGIELSANSGPVIFKPSSVADSYDPLNSWSANRHIDRTARNRDRRTEFPKMEEVIPFNGNT